MKHLLTSLIFTLVTLALTAQTDPGATPETKNLYRNLGKLESRGLMFGHQDDLQYGYGWYHQPGRSDVMETCGDYPGICGWELGHLEQGDALSLDSVFFTHIREGIVDFYNKGGVITISWHGRNPLTGGNAWDVSSKEVVASILPGGSKHALYLTWLDRLADFFLSLKTDDGTAVPVLFRPFHEHTGSWFWWGRNLCTADQYKALWRFTVTYLRDQKHVHNLLYAYSTDRFATEADYLERYPGDDLIDMLAFDLYDRGPEYSTVLKSCAKTVSRLAEARGKLAAVSEAGGPIYRQTDWWTNTLLSSLKGVKLSYVLVWRNPWQNGETAFGPWKGHPSAADFVKFYADPQTLFLREVAAENLYR
jgi:mannan endo-1,4-beta-mannosidase